MHLPKLNIFICWFAIFYIGFFHVETFVFPSTPQPNATLKTLRVYVDWTPNIEFTGMYAALEKGWYEKEGIDLKMVFNGLDIIPGVINGQADICMHSAHDLILHVQKGHKLKAFAAQYQLNPNCIVVGQDSDIKSIKDLKGKVLGIFSPQEYGMYQIMLNYNNLSLDDVKFKKIETFKEAELIELLRQKIVDG